MIQGIRTRVDGEGMMKILSAINPQLNLTDRIVQLPKLGGGKGGIGHCLESRLPTYLTKNDGLHQRQGTNRRYTRRN